MSRADVCTRALVVVAILSAASGARAHESLVDGGVALDKATHDDATLDGGAALDDAGPNVVADAGTPSGRVDDDAIHIHYRPVGCVLGASSNMNATVPLLDALKNVGRIESTFGMLARTSERRVTWNPTRIIDAAPIDALADQDGVSPIAVFDEKTPSEAPSDADDDDVRVVEERIPYLETAEEIVVQVPFAGQRDWLKVIEEGAPRSLWIGRVTRRHGRLLEKQTAKGKVYVLEPEESFAGFATTTTLPGDDRVRPIELRTFGGDHKVTVGDSEVALVSAGKRFGLAERIVVEIDALVSEVPRDASLLVHAGGVLDQLARDLSREGCALALARARPDVYVPSSGDLLLGPEALVDGARAHGLPMVLTNLAPTEPAPEGAGAALPRSRAFALADGRQVLVLGVVGDSVLSRLPADVRARYRSENAVEAVSARIDEEHARLGRKPDLVVVVVSGNAAESSALSTAWHVDVVIGDSARFDLVRRREVVHIDDAGGGREGLGRMAPAFVTRPSKVAVGRVSAFFDDDGAGGTRLARLEHLTRPVSGAGHVDAEVARYKEQLIRGMSDALVLLPDAEDFVLGNDALEEIVFSDRTLISGAIRQYTRALPARYTDALWMRIVANLLRERLDVDAAVLKNVPRGSSVTGPIVKEIVEDWLSDTETVEVVTLDGASLIAILERAKGQEKNLALPGTDYVFVAGADPQSMVIGGRPIARELRYTVAINESLRSLPDVARVLAQASRTEKRFVRVGGHARPSSSGEALRLRAIVLPALEEGADPTAEDATPAQRARVASWLENKSGELTSQWLVRVDELAATGSLYKNSPNVGDFQASRETRTTTPDLYNLGLRLRSSVVYDGSFLAWDTGARALYHAIILDLGDGSFPRNEPLDDALLYSEVRLNRVRLSLDDGAYAVLPFVRAAVDTEFTPTTDPADPTVMFPHQALLQESAGLVAYLGTLVEEVRLGLLVQQDFSEALVPGALAFTNVHLDAGLTFGMRLRVPVWILRLESELDGRYLAPDPDDRTADLALRVQSVNKIVVPLGSAFSVFAFADLFVVSGKLDANRTPGGSAIFGAGAEFRDVWRF